MKISKLIKYLFEEFPKENVCIDDYIGKQFGDQKNEITKVLLCLDFEKDTLDFAIKNNANLVITHHPFFFGKKREILGKLKYKNDIFKMANKNKITVYSFHTNFDNSLKGMNTSILKLLDLKNIHCVMGYPCLAVGELEHEKSFEDFKKEFEKKTGYKCIHSLNYGTNKIKKVGLVGGSASEDVLNSKKLKLDLFISGDVSHHVRREIIGEGLNYLDVPHEIENAFIDEMKRIIESKFNDIKVLTFKEEILPKIK